ncbi:sodium/hydrogen exchanger 8 isoform X8 [Homo sapiens]|uniref:sodium/hydrogen exchanger 8 isoform X8 n=1 Tax=Homo sapiens TaxID=9606 RepID=UPI0005D01A70|nr:sodium/hydrogen exchanger 8 isoform X8 [Homo sapiens]XP_054179261.1 sodium/hydrogen exchanger 8 isoform X8 [Homo sapiens]|eukprot:XP_011527043.1 sodium/hydrogen exchanger 8 isoform X8 [Homo sapiens]
MGEKMAEEERFPNTTHEGFNVTLHTTLVVTTKLVLPTPGKPILPVQTGEQAQQEEQSSGMTIFFSLLVLAICIILVHLLIRYRLHFLPESVAVVSLGILMGAVIKIIEFKKLANWKEEEMFRPNMFFLLLLPPIIFESGYSLHKGNFFQNIGSITLFAVFGTAISAFVVGGGIYFLGQGFFFVCVCVFVCFILQADVISKLNMTDSFAFGSLISAVDPVATIAIFNALHVDPVLNMLVFGESILNDAVSIVLTNTAEGLTRKNMSDVSGWQTFLQALDYFLKMFFGSAALGTLTGLISALVLKHIDLRKTPSLEFGMMIIFAYLPYGLAEGISLSETCVFAFLGLSIFSFPHKFEISFVIWCIVLVLFGRAVNIFPLSYLLNFFRDHKITPKMMFIMWFSGLRGAIPYALSLHLDLEPMEKRQLIGTTTIVIVLFTILLLGGSTMPLIRLMDIEDAKAHRRNKKDVNLSKTEKMGNTVESEHLSELTEEEYEAHYIRRQDLKGFVWLDAKYLNPFFTRRLTQEDLHHGRIQMKTLTNKWYEEVRQGPSGSEDDEQELL